MLDALPYGRQWIDDDIAAGVNVLRSDYLTTGPAIPTFELDATSLASLCKHLDRLVDQGRASTTYQPRITTRAGPTWRGPTAGPTPSLSSPLWARTTVQWTP